MKIVMFVLLLATIGMVRSAVIDCKPLLQPYFNEAGWNNKCILMSGNGLAQDGTQLNYKGNLVFSNNALRPSGNLQLLSSSDYECSSKNKYQPFLADKLQTPEFAIFTNGSAQIGQQIVSLVCVEEHGNSFSASINNVRLSLVMFVRDQCEQLHFGESCSTPTQTPTETPTQTPTETPTQTPTPSSSPVSVTLSIVNTWVTNGVEYAQFQVVLKNNGASTINNLVLGTTNFVPTEKWNIESTSSGDLTLPSYGHIAPGATFEWGFVAKSDSNPSFTVKSISL